MLLLRFLGGKKVKTLEIGQEIQTKIVNMLDRYAALEEELESSLMAEIKERKKPYENQEP